MSFVQRLRMANMFPVRSGLGNARIDDSGNEMYQAIEAGKELALWNRDVLNSGNSGIQQVGNAGRQSTLPEPMNYRFGGHIGRQDLGESIKQKSFAEQNAEVNNAPRQKSNDQIALEDYFKTKNSQVDEDLNRRVKESQITNNNRRVDVVENNSEGNLADKQAKLKLAEDAAANKVATEQGKLDEAKNLKEVRRKSVKDKAQVTLDELNQIVDATTGKLNDRGLSAVGGSRFASHLPWPTKAYEGNKSIDRLKSLLTLDLIGEMKSQSRTGATGFGNMNIREFGALESGASKMDPKLGEENFETQATTVRKYLNDILTDEPEDTIKPISSHPSNNANNLTAPQSTNPNYEPVRRTDNKGWTFQKKVSK